jgi:hypothetical protein
MVLLEALEVLVEECIGTLEKDGLGVEGSVLSLILKDE